MIFFYDFYYFYAAAKIAQSKGNIYDREALQLQMLADGWPSSEYAYGFPYPPWSLIFYYPLGFLSLPLAQIVWLAVGFGAVLLSCAACLSAKLRAELLPFRSSSAQQFLVLSLFFPFFKLLYFGQPAFLMLIGVYGFLWSRASRMIIAAGALLSLTVIKPHVALCFLVAVLSDALLRREWRLLAGFLLGVMLLAAAPMAVLPQIYHQYFQYLGSFAAKSAQLPHPTLASILARTFSLNYLPAFSAVAAVSFGVVCGVRGRVGNTHAIYLLLPASLLLAPYAWSHDFTLALGAYLGLVLPLFRIYSERAIAACLALIFISSTFLVSVAGYEQFLVWIPVALCYFAFRKRREVLSAQYS